jgi:hypothetical protein
MLLGKKTIMPIERTIQTSGGDNDVSYTFTVLFHTTQMTAADANELQRNAAAILSIQNVYYSVYRKIDVFVKNKRTLAIFHYNGNDSAHFQKKKAEEDFERVLEQVATLVEVFDVPKNA